MPGRADTDRRIAEIETVLRIFARRRGLRNLPPLNTVVPSASDEPVR
jgi:hypothetical protein